jgi:hypothetical protein
MQNQLTLDVSIGKPRDGQPEVFCNEDRTFAAANLVVQSVDSEGRTTRAYVDGVTFAHAKTMAEMKAGTCLTVRGRLESHKRENQPWRLRLLIDEIVTKPEQGA